MMSSSVPGSSSAAVSFESIDPSTKTDPEDMYQIALLIDQLKHDDVQIRVNASRNLPLIGMTKHDRVICVIASRK